MQTGNPKTTFLVHGEKDVMQKSAKHLGATEVKIPILHDSFEL